MPQSFPSGIFRSNRLLFMSSDVGIMFVSELNYIKITYFPKKMKYILMKI